MENGTSREIAGFSASRRGKAKKVASPDRAFALVDDESRARKETHHKDGLITTVPQLRAL